jgi:hypothetical protein
LSSFGATTLSAVGLLLEFRHQVLRDAEVHPDRVERGDVRQVRAFRRRIHVGALTLQRAAGEAGDGRSDRRVAEVELRVVDLRIRRENRGSGRVELAFRAIEVRKRQRVLLGQRLHAPERGLGGGEAGLL